MASSTKAVKVAIAGNLAIAISKFIAAAIGGSSAMAAEAIHSLVDTGNGVLLLVGVHRSRKPPDRQHPFGHGKDLYFYSMMVAVLVFGVGGGISIYEGLLHILHPRAIESARLSYLTLVLSAFFEGASWLVAVRQFLAIKGSRSFWSTVRATKDPTHFAVLFEDSAALLGIAFAAIGICLSHSFGMPRADGAASIFIGLTLCFVATVMLRETKDLLIGEAARPDVLEDIRQMLADDPDVVSVRRVLTMQLGPGSLLVNADLQFRPPLTTADMSRAVRRIEGHLRERHQEIQQVFIEAAAASTADPYPSPG